VIEADTYETCGGGASGGGSGFPQRVLRGSRRETRVPEEFVRAMTESGYPGPSSPRSMGDGSGPTGGSSGEDINRSGGTPTRPRAVSIHDGNAFRHGLEEQKSAYLPGTRAVRFGFKPRRDGARGRTTTTCSTTAVRDGDSA